MGSPTLYWYPPGATSPRSFTLGLRLTDLAITDYRDRRTAAPGRGVPVHHDLGGYRTVQLSLERRTTAATIREIRSLAAYLQAGGYLALCLDSAKVWGGWASAAPAAGDTSIYVDTGNAFSSLSSGSLAAGDEITIESPNPELRREFALVSSLAAARTINLDGSTMQGYSTAPVFVRYADFYPALYVAEDDMDSCAPTSDRRLNWTWDLTLTESPGVIAALAEDHDSPFAAKTAGVASFAGMLGAARRRRGSVLDTYTAEPESW